MNARQRAAARADAEAGWERPKMLKQKFHAFTLRPVEPGRFALCDQKLRGPFADNADGVTCKRCLRWPDLVRGVFATQDKARDELGRMIDALPIARPQLRLVPSVRVSPETGCSGCAVCRLAGGAS